MGLVVIGTGNWGSTLAGLLNPNEPLRMWCETQAMVPQVREKVSSLFDRPGGLEVEQAFSSKLTEDDIVLLVIPSSQVASVAAKLGEHAAESLPTIVTASKGLERTTFRTMSQVISSVLPNATVGVISGPNIAKEIAEGRPAKAVLGCEDVHVLLRLRNAIASERFSLDVTRDKVDVELCAAMKGVFAIGAGIIEARQMGCNFMGLMLTYGLREIAEVGKFLGISTVHVFGVAGLGDLVATCLSPDSRNYRLGQLLASGVGLQKALDEVGMVVEGAMTAAAVSEMAALRLRVPLFAAIASIVDAPDEASIAHFERVLLDYPSNGIEL